MQQPSPDETFDPVTPQTDWLRTAAFVLVALGIAGLMLYQQVAAVIPLGQPQGRRVPPTTVVKQTDWIARYAVFSINFVQSMPDPWAQQGQLETQMADTLAETAASFDDPRLYRRAGIVGMWLDDSPQRYDPFKKAVQLHEETDPEQAEAEQELWSTLYGAEEEALPRLTTEDWTRLEPLLSELKLDPWYADLVRLRASELLEQKDRATQLQRRIQSAATRRVVPLLILAGAVLLGALLGFVGAIVIFAVYLAGVWRPVGIKRGIPVRPLWETVVIFFGLLLGLPMAFWSAVGAFGGKVEPLAALLVGITLQALSLVSLVWLTHARPPIAMTDLGWNFRRVVLDVASGVAGYLIALPLLMLSILVVLLLQQLVPQAPAPTHPAIERLIDQPPSPAVLLGMFITVSVMAPLVEELLFRGVMQSALYQRLGAAGAVIVSALIFAFVHPQGPLGLPPLFVLGAVFATLRHLRGSLLPGMVTHSINNAVVMVAIYLMLMT